MVRLIAVASIIALSRQQILYLQRTLSTPANTIAIFTNQHNIISDNSIRVLSSNSNNTVPWLIKNDNDDRRSPASAKLNFSLSPKHLKLEHGSTVEEVVSVEPPSASNITTSSEGGTTNAEILPNNTRREGPLGTFNNPLTIIVHLSGEMGNQLSKITYGYALKWMFQEEHNVTTEILLHHQALSKWRVSATNVQTCFPITRPWSFEAANTDEFEVRKQQQLQWMEGAYDNFRYNRPCDQEECVLRKTAHILKNLHNRSDIPAIEENYNISLPFIFAHEYATISYFNDRYYSRIREFLQFDESNPECCLARAEPDESVFHLRQFLNEMPKKGKQQGFEELSPQKFATELFGSLKAGEKVAFTSRYPANLMVNFTASFESRGIKVRFIEGQNPTQDLCFLMSAQKDFVGCATSSYAAWAAYLGNATKARLYSVKSPHRIARDGNDKYFYRYNWTDTTLQKRVLFQEYNSEAQDEVENNRKQGRLL